MNLISKEKDFKVDLVYLWVDGSDLEWQNKKKMFSPSKNVDINDAAGECRYFNNDELKYSLRSVEENAPWINKIFIITDNQIPDWLNLDNQKLKIVDHSEIIPKDKLPIFNSCAIETRIPYIKELSEHFLYANDDMFIWNSVDKSFFFNGLNPICRFNKTMKKSKDYSGELYRYTIKRVYNIITQKYNISIYASLPHHNIDAYLKSDFLNCILEFKEYFDETLNHRFREKNDMQRTGVAFYSIAKGNAIVKYDKLNMFERLILRKVNDSRCFSIKSKTFKKACKCKSKLVCFNDTPRTTDEYRIKFKSILEKRFPNKSQYEK